MMIYRGRKLLCLHAFMSGSLSCNLRELDSRIIPVPGRNELDELLLLLLDELILFMNGNAKAARDD